MSKVILICCIPFCLLSLSFSQIVETVTSHSEIRDGLHTDDQGNIYVASGGFAGFTIGKYDIQSDIDYSASRTSNRLAS